MKWCIWRCTGLWEQKRMKRKKEASKKEESEIPMIALSFDEDPKLVCRRVLLNTLTKGPAPVEKVIEAAKTSYGFTRAQVMAAAKWFAVAEVVKDGVVWWVKPEVLVALPGWDFRKPQYRGNAYADGAA
jgi:hypothetical protein